MSGLSDVFQTPHQIIPYCIRLLNKTEEYEVTMTKSSISSNFTLSDLQKRDVTIQDLLLWSAPIDVIEHYQNYLDTLTLAFASEIFYNCTLPWFGAFCQFTFESNEPFSEIVLKTFNAKGDLTNWISSQNVTNLTCYMHLECNRGPAPICLDWREICDGRIDCLGDGIDEKGCFELEINECEQNQYRCHNGMCIPEHFINDNPVNPDCLDHTDENDNVGLQLFHAMGFFICFQNPAFPCEESDPFFGNRDLVCGDGQQVRIMLAGTVLDQIEQMQCANGRDFILIHSVITNALRSSNLTDICQTVMYQITSGKYGIEYIGQLCKTVNFPCSISIERVCNTTSYVIVPMLPLIQGYAQFGYWTNKVVIYESLKQSPMPNFVCIDKQRCPFYEPTFNIGNLTCSNFSDTNTFSLNWMIILLHLCSSVDKSGNETDCFHPSLFHCPITSKCISKHRLLDGIIDCGDNADELYTESCNLNHRHRFQCTSENQCISPVAMHDYLYNCHDGEDELWHYKEKLPFQHLCDGYIHLPVMLIDGKNETDETNCEQWPCNNPYTRCDGAWTCPNGADEINCNSTSKCDPNHHECISPTTFKIICLPIDRAGDGNIDCLGATDEREHCRRMYPDEPRRRYRCWNDTSCKLASCSALAECQFEATTSIEKICEQDQHMHEVIQNLGLDFKLGSSVVQIKKYFALYNTSRFQLNALFTSVIIAHDSWALPTGNISRVHSNFLFKVLSREINFRDAWICNRGILIFVGIQKSEYCLCPPSYYGNQCQFQNQRVSLTLQFSKECDPICYGVYGIVLTLVDSDQEIHSYEQLTYTSTDNCDMKYNIYLLYRSRPKNLKKNYTIRIDAYNKIDLTYHTSWILPVKFLFLPVNRIAAYLTIPAHPAGVSNNCSLICGDHGRCAIYTNTREYFCRCDSRWSGPICTMYQNGCDCATESICLGTLDNRSICLCPSSRIGPRCFIPSICQKNPCKNGGQCIPEDDRISISSFTCINNIRYSGNTCNTRDTRIEISFSDIEIPQSLRIHFVTVQKNDDPLITTTAQNVALGKDSIVVCTPVLFNLILIQIDTEFFLAFLQVNALRLTLVKLEMKAFYHCHTVQSLFDGRTSAFLLLRRAKYYHVLCKNYSQLNCMHDNETFMCLCNDGDYANCFPFDFNKTSICPGRMVCENGGQCLLDRAICPTSTICICPECFYGERCQLTTKSFSLSLDVILGYHIRPHIKIIQQSVAVKVSITLTTVMLVIGLINGILSIMTFQLKKFHEVGCGFYLLALSITSLISTIILVLKLWLLILSQMSWITNRTTLLIQCISIEFILRSFTASGDWFSACVAIERVFVMMIGINFSQTKSKKIARWVIITIMLCIFLSLFYDPIHRELIDDKEEQRTWCIVQYSSTMKIFDSAMHILHFFIPFTINLFSAVVIIVSVARTHSTSHKHQNYRQHLCKEFHRQKHLIISPIILVILAVPRLIFSFFYGCMKSIRNPWLFLTAYFISFIPSLLTFIVFIWPSETYKKEFITIVKRHRMAIRRRLHLE